MWNGQTVVPLPQTPIAKKPFGLVRAGAPAAAAASHCGYRQHQLLNLIISNNKNINNKTAGLPPTLRLSYHTLPVCQSVCCFPIAATKGGWLLNGYFFPNDPNFSWDIYHNLPPPLLYMLIVVSSQFELYLLECFWIFWYRFRGCVGIRWQPLDVIRVIVVFTRPPLPSQSSSLAHYIL